MKGKREYRLRVLPILVLLLASCDRQSVPEEGYEDAFFHKLEEAVTLGERYLAERDSIEKTTMTLGMDAALELEARLHHRAGYEAFWACLESADSIWQEIPNAERRKVARSKMTPKIERIVGIVMEIERE